MLQDLLESVPLIRLLRRGSKRFDLKLAGVIGLAESMNEHAGTLTRSARRHCTDAERKEEFCEEPNYRSRPSTTSSVSMSLTS